MSLLRASVVIALVCACSVHQTQANSKEMVVKLYKDLFQSDNYDKRVRPVSYLNETLRVHLSLGMRSLVEVDEQSQTMTSMVQLNLVWMNKLLTWNPSDYDGVEGLLVRQKDVWLPDIQIKNSVDVQEVIGYDNFLMYLEPCGTMYWSPLLKISTSCDIDITYYPFDAQICHFDVGTAYTIDYEMTVYAHNSFEGISLTDDPYLGDYNKDGTWDMVDWTSDNLRNNEDWASVIRYSFVLQRKRTYFILNIILPVMFLSTTATLVFALPANAGEKMGTSITVLLAYAVYLTIVSEYMPDTSLQVSLLSMYLTLLLGLCALSVIVSTFILRVHDKPDSHHVGKKLSRFTKWVNGKKKQKHKGKKMDDTDKEKNIHSDSGDVKGDGESQGQGGDPDEDTVSWQDVAKALDWFSFITSTLVNILVTVAFAVALVVGGENSVPSVSKENITEDIDFKEFWELTCCNVNCSSYYDDTTDISNSNISDIISNINDTRRRR